MWFFNLVGAISLLCMLGGLIFLRQQAGASYRRMLQIDRELVAMTAAYKAEQGQEKVQEERQALLGEIIATGTTTTETVHKTIAGLIFDILEAIPPTRDTAKIVRAIHNKTASGVYDAIHTLNQQIEQMGLELGHRTPPQLLNSSRGG